MFTLQRTLSAWLWKAPERNAATILQETKPKVGIDGLLPYSSGYAYRSDPENQSNKPNNVFDRLWDIGTLLINSNLAYSDRALTGLSEPTDAVTPYLAKKREALEKIELEADPPFCALQAYKSLPPIKDDMSTNSLHALFVLSVAFDHLPQCIVKKLLESDRNIAVHKRTLIKAGSKTIFSYEGPHYPITSFALVYLMKRGLVAKSDNSGLFSIVLSEFGIADECLEKVIHPRKYIAGFPSKLDSEPETEEASAAVRATGF